MVKHFNDKLCVCSPLQKDYARKVNYDEDGVEYIVYEEVDYPALLRSNGFVGDWNLNNLLKAGINPDFPIHTGLNTRIEGVAVIQDAAATLDSILADESKAE